MRARSGTSVRCDDININQAKLQTSKSAIPKPSLKQYRKRQSTGNDRGAYTIMKHLNKASVWVPVTVALTFVLGFLAGDMLNSQSGPTPTQKKFQTIINLIRKDYVDEVNLDSLLEHTLPSMLTNLDPHSAYIPAKDLRSVNEELDGSFCGIGVQFMLNNDTITVIEVISGGPAEKVGMMAGDRIVKVDDEIVAGIGITQEQVLKKLRGERDTKVKLGIKRPNSKKTLKFDVTRGDIPVTSIDAAYIGDKTGILRRKNHIKQFLLEKERNHTEHNDHCRDPEQHSPKHVKMVPEGHTLRAGSLTHLSPLFSLLSLLMSVTSFSISFMPSLNDLTPFPRPFINSGIFLPPKKRSTTSAMSRISDIPRPPINNIIIRMIG